MKVLKLFLISLIVLTSSCELMINIDDLKDIAEEYDLENTGELEEFTEFIYYFEGENYYEDFSTTSFVKDSSRTPRMNKLTTCKCSSGNCEIPRPRFIELKEEIYRDVIAGRVIIDHRGIKCYMNFEIDLRENLVVVDVPNSPEAVFTLFELTDTNLEVINPYNEDDYEEYNEYEGDY